MKKSPGMGVPRCGGLQRKESPGMEVSRGRSLQARSSIQVGFSSRRMCCLYLSTQHKLQSTWEGGCSRNRLHQMGLQAC